MTAVGSLAATRSSTRVSVSRSGVTSLRPPTVYEQREALIEHFLEAMKIHGEQLAGRRMRKMGIRYARFHPNAEQVKQGFIEVLSLRDWQKVLEIILAAYDDDPRFTRCDVFFGNTGYIFNSHSIEPLEICIIIVSRQIIHQDVAREIGYGLWTFQ